MVLAAGFSFLFGPALLALPLAALPVIVHLLFRRKSPVILFPTIRFIQASVQKTAARKRVRRWVLLSIRILLLALLITAVAQPIRQSEGGWAASGKSAIAAVVVDTSYSMLASEHNQTLLARADAAVRELLGGQLASAKVAIFRSSPPASGQAETLRESGAILAEWSPLTPEPSPRPLADRVAAAVDLLDRQHADDKWLVVISDFQKKEFPSPMPKPAGAHVVLIDLHAEGVRSAGITRVAISPAQPTPGMGIDSLVDVAGKANMSRAVSLVVQTPAGAKLAEAPVQVAALDGSGHARVRFMLKLPAQPWMLIKASLIDDDDMPWDNTRTLLVQTPPKQIVAFLGDKPTPDSVAWPIWLALDPSEGAWPEGWSLSVRAARQIPPGANVAVMIVNEWPDESTALRLNDFASSGGTLIWFLRPGLEQTWAAVPFSTQAALKRLLPADPLALTPPVCSASVAAPADPLFAGAQPNEFTDLVVRRMVPFLTDAYATTLLQCNPIDPKPGQRTLGLLYRKPVRAGSVCTFTTLPEAQFSDMRTHPRFLPMLVRLAQRTANTGEARNIEIGQSLAMQSKSTDALNALSLQSPASDLTQVKAEKSSGGTIFNAGPAISPGVYSWLRPDSNEPLAMTNVQLPSDESELTYVSPDQVAPAGADAVIARSVDELKGRIARLNEGQPVWTMPIAIALLLLCAESMIASLSRLWEPRRSAPAMG